LSKSLSDNITSLRRWAKEGIYSLEAFEGASKVATSLKEIFGVDVSSKFVLDNLSLIEDMMMGVEGSAT
jgi:hypothetical protein